MRLWIQFPEGMEKRIKRKEKEEEKKFFFKKQIHQPTAQFDYSE